MREKIDHMPRGHLGHQRDGPLTQKYTDLPSAQIHF